jgi:hypothetical protein
MTKQTMPARKRRIVSSIFIFFVLFLEITTGAPFDSVVEQQLEFQAD